MAVKIHESWQPILSEEFAKPYFQQIATTIRRERQEGKIVYPAGQFIFNAFNLCPWQKVQVVLLGQDPYHGIGQAHGLSFSVPYGIKTPPSLQNIYKELATDIEGFEIPTHGNLEQWAQQGVLLLNTSLTVRAAEPGSHSAIGWEKFTDAVIQKISTQKENIVFILWGNFAQKKVPLIHSQKHLILASAHPSPFSAYQGFFGSKPFSRCNTYLSKHGKPPIDWNL